MARASTGHLQTKNMDLKLLYQGPLRKVHQVFQYKQLYHDDNTILVYHNRVMQERPWMLRQTGSMATTITIIIGNSR